MLTVAGVHAKWDFDSDDQPAIGRIPRDNLAVTSRDSPLRDCKAEPRSFVPCPVFCLDATKGQKNLRKHGFRHTWPRISHLNDRATMFAADRHVDGCTLASVANAITHDILDGAAEQFFGAVDRAFFEGGDSNMPRC